MDPFLAESASRRTLVWSLILTTVATLFLFVLCPADDDRTAWTNVASRGDPAHLRSVGRCGARLSHRTHQPAPPPPRSDARAASATR